MEESSFNISFPLGFWTRYGASLVLIHRLWSTWVAYAFFVVIPVVALLGGLLLHLNLSQPGFLGLPGWVALLGGFFFMFVFMPLLQILQLWLASRRNRTLIGIQTQHFSREGFSVSGETFETKLKWDAILKVVETRSFFFLYISARAAYFIPKGCLSGKTELERLRSFLQDTLPDRTKLLKPVLS